jgi:hypothetical protein
VRTFDIGDGCLDAGEGFKPPSVVMVRQMSGPASETNPHPWEKAGFGSRGSRFSLHAFLQDEIDMVRCRGTKLQCSSGRK